MHPLQALDEMNSNLRLHNLLAEQPENIKGIAAPGMPQGSPGMESPNPSKYKVLSVSDQGEVEVYAIRDGQNAH